MPESGILHVERVDPPARRVDRDPLLPARRLEDDLARGGLHVVGADHEAGVHDHGVEPLLDGAAHDSLGVALGVVVRAPEGPEIPGLILGRGLLERTVAHGRDRGAVDEPLDPGLERGLADVLRPLDVHLLEPAACAPPGALGRHARDVIDAPHALHGGADGLLLRHISRRDFDVQTLETPARLRGGPREGPDLLASLDELAHEVDPDEAGRARDEGGHRGETVPGGGGRHKRRGARLDILVP